jgi:hypothetical protein
VTALFESQVRDGTFRRREEVDAVRRTGIRGRVVKFVGFAIGVLIGERIMPPEGPSTWRSRLGEIYRAEIDAFKEGLAYPNDRRIGEFVWRVAFGDRRVPGWRRTGG